MRIDYNVFYVTNTYETVAEFFIEKITHVFCIAEYFITISRNKNHAMYPLFTTHAIHFNNANVRLILLFAYTNE